MSFGADGIRAVVGPAAAGLGDCAQEKHGLKQAASQAMVQQHRGVVRNHEWALPAAAWAPEPRRKRGKLRGILPAPLRGGWPPVGDSGGNLGINERGSQIGPKEQRKQPGKANDRPATAPGDAVVYPPSSAISCWLPVTIGWAPARGGTASGPRPWLLGLESGAAGRRCGFFLTACWPSTCSVVRPGRWPSPGACRGSGLRHPQPRPSPGSP